MKTCSEKKIVVRRNERNRAKTSANWVQCYKPRKSYFHGETVSFFTEDPMLAQVAFMASMEVLNGKLANSQPPSDLQGTLQRPPPVVEAITAWPPCQRARPLGKAFISH